MRSGHSREPGSEIDVGESNGHVTAPFSNYQPLCLALRPRVYLLSD